MRRTIPTLTLTLVLLQVLAVAWPRLAQAAPLGTAFTYQGRLIDANVPADGIYEFEFKLYDAPSDGNQIGRTVEIWEFDVIDGYFAVELDFGDGDPNVFNGDRRWMEIGVFSDDIGEPCEPDEPDESDEFTILSPRQEIKPVPYSLLSRGISVDALRNVGIGTTEPAARLHVLAPFDLDPAGILLESPGGSMLELAAKGHASSLGTQDNSPLSIVTNDSERIHIAAAGNIGIGTTDPQAPVHVVEYGADPAVKATNWENGDGLYGNSSLGRGVYGEGGVSGVHGKVSGGANGVYGEHARGTSGYLGGDYGAYGSGYSGSYGYLGGTNTGIYGYSYSWRETDDEPPVIIEEGFGVMAYGGGCDFYAKGPGVDFASGSSIRWKSDVRPIDDPLAKLLALRGVYFNWDADHGGRHDVGMIAEEVGKVLPEVVSYEQNGVDAVTMDYSKLTPLLVEAVKELKQQADEREKRLAQKELEIEGLGDRLSKLETMMAKFATLENGAK